MRARIYQPARNAMQSGMARSHGWVLEFLPAERREIDPLMGWTGSGDTQRQVHLRFATRQEAEDYARDNGIEVAISAAHQRKPNVRPGGYGDNFATNRRTVWTH
ncbi:ETC complex I subunit [Rhodobacter veldkampii DSM 11550]|uniref:ETC complex I subunit n=1 Tax=Phaeovulum veldkampii DSM 11550 TaxID=1185920 RepID=A0A2T4JGD7_9RHOB|nr:ETC complex I subunit [Phaeovulum veldkampii]MBK5944952.1 ETC complex I subunit [Phaeovulum veldkampii DSM 11550]NCU20096.1 ETC complex I subunit [Candidatus Falkowbacteria bacterium]PTE16956.1 ETC complex I subunit [Phaeovulum veldkampii DSM 11550]TDQ55983.1 NADH dehydrogenase [Phaeovulum veldkampii DSM 11550]